MRWICASRHLEKMTEAIALVAQQQENCIQLILPFSNHNQFF